MEDINYIVILDYANSKVYNIDLNEIGRRILGEYDNIEVFIEEEILDHLMLNSDEVHWMACKKLSTVNLKF